MGDIEMIMGRPIYYRLDEDHNVLPATRDQTVRIFENHESRVVGKDKIGEQDVSTVFLVIDHGYGDDPPIVFESMIFGGSYNEYQWRYSTWDEAVAGHARIVGALKEGIEP